MENSAGVLTVKFEGGAQLIFSRQEPLRQLWLADRSGGFHFDYDEETKSGSAKERRAAGRNARTHRLGAGWRKAGLRRDLT